MSSSSSKSFPPAISSPHKILQLGSQSRRQSLTPVFLTIDQENYELRIRRMPSSITPSITPPQSPQPKNSMNIPKFLNISFEKFLRPNSRKLSKSSNPQLLQEEVISFDEIHEFRCSVFDTKSTSDEILEQLQIQTMSQSQSQSKSRKGYKMGTLLFGKQFNLTKYTFIVAKINGDNHSNNAGDGGGSIKGQWKNWVQELMKGVEEFKEMSYFDKLVLWYNKQFSLVLENSIDTHRLKLWKRFLVRLHHRISSEKLSSDYRFLNKSKDEGPKCGSLHRSIIKISRPTELTKEEFIAGARYFLHSGKTIERVFQTFDETIMSDYLSAAENLKGRHAIPKIFLDMISNYLAYIALAKSEYFLDYNYSMKLDAASNEIKLALRAITRRLVGDKPDIVVQHRLLSSNYVLDYLFSEHNSIWNNDFTKLYQDMDRPLSEYWISSSHNTYLTGDQYSSLSSVECYIRALRCGCRCIEIDVWNGYSNKPIVKHGMTLTSSIPLKDVLQAVKKNAFITTDYPLIISIENHCNLRQQKVMAKYFRKLFGKALVTAPLEVEGIKSQVLPSPNQLKNRVIIKGRSLPLDLGIRNSSVAVTDDADEVVDGKTEVESESNSCDCLMSGELWKDDDRGNWIPYLFVLTHKKLFYVELVEQNQNQYKDKEEVSKRRSSTYQDRTSAISVTSNLDLHIDQVWYHGNLGSGEEQAEALIKDFSVSGAFLVRDNDSGDNFGEYILSFFDEGKVHHFPILATTDRMFHLKSNPEELFPSLYELIEYYQTNPINESESECLLGPPVPPPTTHENEEWFYKDMNREESEAILNKLHENGTFLARYSTTHPGTIVISLRYRNLVKHCAIKSEGKYLIVSNLKFAKLESLVRYYERHPFYRDTKLTHAVGQDLLNKSQANGANSDPRNQTDYIYSSVQPVTGTVRAVQSFYSDDNDSGLLSFKKGDIIENVVKSPDGWWSGIKRDEMNASMEAKQFCSSFVVECDDLEDDTLVSKGTFSMGCGAKWEACKDKNGNDKGIKFYLKFKFPNGTVRKLGAKCSRTEIDEWVEMINYVVDKDEEGKKKSAKVVAAMEHNIAPEYSDLIIYCKSMRRLNPQEIGKDMERVDGTLVKSLDETSADNLFRSRPSYFVWYHQFAMTRIYPRARLLSSNPSPVQFWNFGSQMVALNWQTDDKPMQWNRGKFRENGNCGFVLKPKLLLPGKDELHFNPTKMTRDDYWNEMTLKIEIISGRHLTKQKKGPITPIVEVEIVGIDADCSTKTTTVAAEDTGLNPFWHQSFFFKVMCSQLALIQFSVYHMDTFTGNELLGESTIPLRCIRDGFRSVQLNNSFGEPLLLSTLLVKIMRYVTENDGNK